MKIKLVGICGEPRSGKTTFGRFLQSFINGLLLFGFGDCIRQACRLLWNVPIIEQEAHREEWRSRWQQIGMEGRGISEDYWIKQWITYTTIDRAEGGIIVMPDVRFQNEVEFIEREGGIIFKISRPLEGGVSQDWRHHPCETQKLNGTFYQVDNDRSLLHLYEQAKTWATWITQVNNEDKEAPPKTAN